MRNFRDWRIFALVCVCLGGMGQGVVAPKMPELLAGTSRQVLLSGIGATLMYLGIFVSTFRFGKWSDAGKVHWLLAPGLVFYSAILLVLGGVSHPGTLFAARFAEGISLSAIFVAADFLLGRLSADGERGQWLSYYGVALSVGLLLGPLVALGFTYPLAITSAVAMFLGYFAWRVRVPQVADDCSDALPVLARGPLLVGAAYGFMEAGLVAVFPMLAGPEFGVRPEYCLVAVILSAAATSVFWGILSDRRGPWWVIRILLVLLIGGPLGLLVLGRIVPPVLTAFSSCVLFGTLAGGLYPVGFAWLLERLNAKFYGYASGSFARYYGAGSLVGPLAVGFASEYARSPGLFLSISIIGMICLGAVTWDARKVLVAGGLR